MRLYLQAFLAVWPVINQLLRLWIRSPEEKRAKLIGDLGAAFRKAEATQGDTSEIEKLIKKGKP